MLILLGKSSPLPKVSTVNQQIKTTQTHCMLLAHPHCVSTQSWPINQILIFVFREMLKKVKKFQNQRIQNQPLSMAIPVLTPKSYRKLARREQRKISLSVNFNLKCDKELVAVLVAKKLIQNKNSIGANTCCIFNFIKNYFCLTFFTG